MSEDDCEIEMRKILELYIPWDLRDRLDGPLNAMAAAALTAAAEIDVDRRHWPPHLVKAAIAKERERCAQVADDYAKKIKDEWGYVAEWIRDDIRAKIEAAESIVHAIRALKDQP
jgi:hypothetical protein